MKLCSNCNKEVKDKATYCPHCGKVVSWLKIINQPWMDDTHTGTWWDNKMNRILPIIIVAILFVMLKGQIKSILDNTFGRLLHAGPQYATVEKLKSMTCKKYKDSSTRDKFVISKKLYTDVYGNYTHISEGTMKIEYDVGCELNPEKTLGKLNIHN